MIPESHFIYGRGSNFLSPGKRYQNYKLRACREGWRGESSHDPSLFQACGARAKN